VGKQESLVRISGNVLTTQQAKLGESARKLRECEGKNFDLESRVGDLQIENRKLKADAHGRVSKADVDSLNRVLARVRREKKQAKTIAMQAINRLSDLMGPRAARRRVFFGVRSALFPGYLRKELPQELMDEVEDFFSHKVCQVWTLDAAWVRQFHEDEEKRYQLAPLFPSGYWVAKLVGNAQDQQVNELVNDVRGAWLARAVGPPNPPAPGATP
jgi:hypothetical protein